MKNIKVKIDLQNESNREELLKKVRAKGFSDIDIGRQLCKRLGGGNARALATQYGSFRNGQRSLSKKLIPGVAEILEVPEDILRKLNDKSACTQVLLQFDSKLKLKEFIGSIPEECDTMDKFLVWLSTEIERRELLSRL